MSDVLEFPSLPAQSATGPTHQTVQRRMRVGRALGPVVATYEDIWEAYRQCRRLGRKGPLGVVQFMLFTNWHLKHVERELDAKMDSRFPHLSCHPNPADLGYHWPTPRYEGQTPMKCDYLAGGQCYYDGSGLGAERIYEVLLKEGDEGVWRELEEFYRDVAGREEAA